MKAMILAAGKGTRLAPLTDIYPKALVPMANTPLIDRTIQYLRSYGVRQIIINTYHLHKKIENHLKALHEGVDILELTVEKNILGTGGGIKNTENFWGKKPFIVVNGDILTNIDIAKVYRLHKKQGNLITMVLHDHPRYNKIIVDNRMNILSIEKNIGSKNSLAFTGVQVISPEALKYIPKNTTYDIVDCYKTLIAEKKPIKGHLVYGHRWFDIGTIEDYINANLSFLPATRNLIAPHCVIDPHARKIDQAILGNGCSIERGAIVKNSVLWDHVTVKEGIRVIDSVIASHVIVARDMYNAGIIK